jgi:hypothetical protein
MCPHLFVEFVIRLWLWNWREGPPLPLVFHRLWLQPAGPLVDDRLIRGDHNGQNGLRGLIARAHFADRAGTPGLLPSTFL